MLNEQEAGRANRSEIEEYGIKLEQKEPHVLHQNSYLSPALGDGHGLAVWRCGVVVLV